MDPNSGKILHDILPAEAEKHGLVPIPDSELETVKRMNRHDRRAWAANQRAKKTFLEGSKASKVVLR